ncbi:MAG: twin-arginine translocation signal domain-containing protein, partial [Cupriavidus sp.]|uniref:twin-arginine translocation signal domain-containing protein n=1 Tax=Cupriavidus sp. TaxID=1873897 RepID=UPI0025C31347
MRRDRPSGILLPNLPRRRFVQGLAAGGVMAGLSALGGIAWAQSSGLPQSASSGTAPVLTGTEFDLVIAES